MRRCRQLAASLPVPDPFDLNELLARLAQQRGRPITVLPMPSRPGAPYGLLATTARNDYIFHAANTSALHQQHIVMHELAHLVLGHDRAFPAAADEPLAAFAGLLDALPPELVVRVLGRQAYSEPQEQEAELLASLLLCGSPRRAGTADPDEVDEAHQHPGIGLFLGFAQHRKPAHG